MYPIWLLCKRVLNWVISKWSFVTVQQRGNNSSPEEYPQDVCHQENQAHIGGEPLCVLGPADVSVLGDVGTTPPNTMAPAATHDTRLLNTATICSNSSSSMLSSSAVQHLAEKLWSDVSWLSLPQRRLRRGVSPRLDPWNEFDSVTKQTSVSFVHNPHTDKEEATATPSQAEQWIRNDDPRGLTIQ